MSVYTLEGHRNVVISGMSESDAVSERPEITRYDFLQERAEQFKSVADDTRSLLKTNFLVIGFFLPIIGSLFSGQLSPEKVFNNAYTQVGLIVWVLSTAFLSLGYHRARVVAKAHFDPVEAAMLGDIPEEERRYRIQDKIDQYSNMVARLDLLISVCTLLTLTATTLFAVGVLLPYVSVIPQVGVLRVVGAILGLAVLIGIANKFKSYLPSLDNLLDREKSSWSELTKPRQDLLKKIYVAVGEEPFQLSDLPLKRQRDVQSGTIPSTQSDDSNILLRDVFDEKVSEYLLEQMVDKGYFEKEGDTDATTIRPPHTYEESTINKIGEKVEIAIDRLGRELDSHEEAREAAAEELNLRTDEVLEELRTGDELTRIKRYNRIVEALQDEDFELSARPFEFTSDEITYIPTELAKKAYEKIELEKRSREYDREMAERREEVRRAENTHRYRVVEPADEHGQIQVVTHDPTVLNSQHHWLYIPDAEVSSQERRRLENLEAGNEVTLRIETNMQTGDDYIASVDGP